MTPQTYKRIVLNSRPTGDFEPDTFRTEVLPFTSLGEPGKQQVLVQCTWISLDPAMRGYVRDARSYLPPVQIGEVVILTTSLVAIELNFWRIDYASCRTGCRHFHRKG